MTLPVVPLDEKMTPEVRRFLTALIREIESTIDSIGDIVVPTKASAAEAVTGTNDEKFLTPLSGISTVRTYSPFLQFAYYEDQKAANTAGGSASPSNTYNTRTLNTEVYDTIGCTLSSNEITIPAGTYYIEASCPAFRVSNHKARLYNVTNTAVLAYGTSEYGAVGSGDLVSTRSWITAKFTVANDTAIRLEHAVTNPTNSDDYGRAANQTGSEVYSTLKIWRLD